eukprot:3566570-Alexandrium_andersonii.AAC.1
MGLPAASLMIAGLAGAARESILAIAYSARMCVLAACAACEPSMWRCARLSAHNATFKVFLASVAAAYTLMRARVLGGATSASAEGRAHAIKQTLTLRRAQALICTRRRTFAKRDILSKAHVVCVTDCFLGLGLIGAT